MTDTLSKVVALRDGLQANLLEREAAIDAAILALVTRELALFLGPPGTAKSLLVRAVCDRIEGASYFERLLTKFSTPEELFGPLTLSAPRRRSGSSGGGRRGSPRGRCGG
jgi:MoxR-like ATPase